MRQIGFVDGTSGLSDKKMEKSGTSFLGVHFVFVTAKPPSRSGGW